MLMSPYNRSLRPLIFIVHLNHFTSIIIHYFFWLKEGDAFSLIRLVLSVIKEAVDLRKTTSLVETLHCTIATNFRKYHKCR